MELAVEMMKGRNNLTTKSQTFQKNTVIVIETCNLKWYYLEGNFFKKFTYV